jgi:hypothetical protein
MAGPNILFLPLVNMEAATQETATAVTKLISQGFSQLDLAQVMLAPDVLRELGLTLYDHDNQKLRKRISEFTKPDFVLSGYLKISKSGNYSLQLQVSEFATGAIIYQMDYSGSKDWGSLVKRQLDLLSTLYIFIKDPEAKRTANLKLLARYCPNGFTLVQELMKIYDFDILHFYRSGASISEELNVVVHEGCHAYTHFKESNRYSFYIDRKETIVLKLTDVFPSSEIAGVIPAKLRTSCYTDYIIKSSANLSTQSDGVYGLLDEFNAYYHGTLASCDLFEYYKKEVFKDNPKVFFDYLWGVNYTAYTYYEFKYFIFEYLIYAQSRYPKSYKQIMDNKEFVGVFRKLDRLYAALLERIAANEAELASLLAARGYLFYKKDGFTYIGKTGEVNSGINNFDDTLILFRDELKDKRFAGLEAIFK